MTDTAGIHPSPTPLTGKQASLFGSLLSGTVFNVLILLTLTVPLVTYVMHTFFTTNQIWMTFIFIVPFLGGLSGTHVFATTYLYLDCDLSVGVSHHRLKLYVIPLLIIVLNMAAIAALPLGVLLWFMVFFVHYAMFHFGRQNIGVLTFSLLSTKRKSATSAEKLILNAVTACGMLAAMKVFSPGLMLDPQKYRFDLSLIEPIMSALYGTGMLLYPAIVAYALHYFITNRHRFGGYGAAIYWMCVFWYAPIYLFPTYPMLNLALYTTAHGLQYLVFLGFHAYYESRRRAAISGGTTESAGGQSRVVPVLLSALPVGILLGAIGLAWWLWTNQGSLFLGAGFLIDQVIANDGVFKVGAGLILGLTMAHYWVDQHIWKFKNPERRKWLMQRYPFLAAT